MSADFPEPCPECQQNKHLNCDGTTWNPATDEPDGCPCAKRGHEPLRADNEPLTDATWQGPFIAAALGRQRIVLEHTRKGPHWVARPKEER